MILYVPLLIVFLNGQAWSPDRLLGLVISEKITVVFIH